MNCSHRPAARRRAARRSRKGISIVAAAVLMTALSGLTISALMMSNSAIAEQIGARNDLAARYAADAGLAVAVHRLNNEGPQALAELQQPADLGGARYWIETEVGADGMASMVATGEVGLARYRQQLVVQRQPVSLYRYGAFGDEHLELASNAQVDSYASGQASYLDQRVNGSGQSAWARDLGNIGSNADIELRQNGRTYGDARPGPSGGVMIVGNAFVTGSVTPAGETIELLPIEMPAIASSGDLVTPHQGTLQLGAGDHAFDSGHVSVGSTLEIEGPARLVFDSLEILKNASVIVDSTKGMVEIFVRDDFVMSSNTLVSSNTQEPADIALFLESDNIIQPDEEVDLDVIDFESNSEFYGTVYAPNAHVIINSNLHLYGSIIARRLRLDSNTQIHYDEDMLKKREEDQTELKVIGWRVLPRRADPNATPAFADPVQPPESDPEPGPSGGGKGKK